MNEVRRLTKAFTDEQAARLARISIGQIRYWDETNFFEPSISYENRRVAFSRIYSFDDVVGLRVLGELRNIHDVPLQHLRRVRDKLKLPQSIWREEEIFVHQKRVYFRNERGNHINAETGEETLPNIPLPRIIASVHHEAQALGVRTREVHGKKVKNKSIARSAEVFEGTRIPIDLVAEYFEEGLGLQDILRDYPTLTEDDINAAVLWLGISAA